MMFIEKSLNCDSFFYTKKFIFGLSLFLSLKQLVLSQILDSGSDILVFETLSGVVSLCDIFFIAAGFEDVLMVKIYRYSFWRWKFFSKVRFAVQCGGE